MDTVEALRSMMVTGAARSAKLKAGARRRKLLRVLMASSAILVCLPANRARAQENDPILQRTNLGIVGLIEMPSARMGPDGQLSAEASYSKNTQHYNLGFQVLPWLETSFRYSGLQHFDPTYSVYYDRSFAFKARLWNEGDLMPAVALGINDVVGTGIYNGEYLVASKQFGNFDTTLGIGWGRLGTANTLRNPLTFISHSFAPRPNQFTQSAAGASLLSSLFHGPQVGVFGGVVWHTPIDGLALTVESSSDRYRFESLRGTFTPHSRMNYGLAYQATEGITLGLSWLYGTTIGGNITFQFDPKHALYPGTLNAPPPVVIRSPEAQRVALESILDQRNPDIVAQQITLQRRAAETNMFVDSLFIVNDFKDVRLTGDTLTLAVIGNPTQRLCQAAAANVPMGSGIETIVLATLDSPATTRCSVPRRVGANLQNAAFLTHANTVADPSGPSVLLQTIDATATNGANDASIAIRAFKTDARKQNIGIVAVSFGNSEALVYYTNSHYFSETNAIERLTRLLMADAPTRIEKFRLISVSSGVPLQEFTVLRGPVERSKTQNDEDTTIFDGTSAAIEPSPLYNPVLVAGERGTFPRFSWGLYPQFRQEFFDPSNPVGVQFLAAAGASVEFAPGLSVSGQAETSIFDTFSTGRSSDSLLPHVRSDFLNYFTQGKTGIGSLETDYQFRLAPDVIAVARAGYLESMFAGAGGEVLWRPAGQRWALGADLYQVWQRDFDRLFGLQNYHQVTGHISLYYSSPWYGLNFVLRAGQYLAGDRGFTLQVTRRFSTGIEIGAFATRTNVSATQFGEGSFDKGIIIHIPLDWIAPIDSQSGLSMDLRPVQRDGGQTLNGDAILYEVTRRSSEAEIRSIQGQ